MQPPQGIDMSSQKVPAAEGGWNCLSQELGVGGVQLTWEAAQGEDCGTGCFLWERQDAGGPLKGPQ